MLNAWVGGDLALAIALVSRVGGVAMASAKSVGQNLFGCCAVGFFRRVFVRQPSPVPVLFLFALKSPCLRKRLVVPVEILYRWGCRTLFYCRGEFVGLLEGHCC
jgi:hypothetical protein